MVGGSAVGGDGRLAGGTSSSSLSRDLKLRSKIAINSTTTKILPLLVEEVRNLLAAQTAFNVLSLSSRHLLFTFFPAFFAGLLTLDPLAASSLVPRPPKGGPGD